MHLDSTTLARFWTKVDRSGGSDACWLWLAGTLNGYGVLGIGGKQWRSHRLAWVLANGTIPAGMFVCHTCDTPGCVNARHLWLGTAAQNSADMLSKGRAARGDRSGRHTHPESTARGDRNGARTHPERLARGTRNARSTHPETTARGDRNGMRLHPDKVLRGDQHPARLHPERMARGKANGQHTHPERRVRGERHTSAKLTDDQVRAIYRRTHQGETCAAIAREFGVTDVAIGCIKRGKTWRHVTHHPLVARTKPADSTEEHQDHHAT